MEKDMFKKMMETYKSQPVEKELFADAKKSVKDISAVKVRAGFRNFPLLVIPS